LANRTIVLSALFSTLFFQDKAWLREFLLLHKWVSKVQRSQNRASGLSPSKECDRDLGFYFKTFSKGFSQAVISREVNSLLTQVQGYNTET